MDAEASNPTPPTEETSQDERRLPIQTYHCRCCSHLLLASTLDILAAATASSSSSSKPGLARRKDPALDHALILPIPSRRSMATASSSTGATGGTYTILLSTTLPDSKPVIVCREDGFERRICLRCGRCRVVVGYFLDHATRNKSSVMGNENENDDEDEEEGGAEEDRVAYILPGALVGTEDIATPDGDDDDDAGGVDLPIRRNEILRKFEAEWLDWVS
jgi:hypothetical protein